jgi:hypothetical protein
MLGTAEAGGVEKTLFAADACVVVAGPDGAGFDRVRPLLHAHGSEGPATPMGIIAPEGVAIAADVPVASGPRASITALQALLKPMMAELAKKLD